MGSGCGSVGSGIASDYKITQSGHTEKVDRCGQMWGTKTRQDCYWTKYGTRITDFKSEIERTYTAV